MIYLIFPAARDAEAWARLNGLEPHERRIITHPLDLAGVRFFEDDRIVEHEHARDRLAAYDDVDRQIATLRATSFPIDTEIVSS